MKLTLKQELFAQHYAIHMCATDAYREIYRPKNPNSEWVYAEASKVKDNQRVATRIKELQGDLAAKTMVTLESITQELFDIKKLAIEDKQFSPAVSAVVNVAKMHGLMIDKIETSGKSGSPIIFKTVYESEPSK
jgi:phage terminase small subunit